MQFVSISTKGGRMASGHSSCVIAYGSSETELQRICGELSNCQLAAPVRRALCKSAEDALAAMGGKTAHQWSCAFAVCILCAASPREQQAIAAQTARSTGYSACAILSSSMSTRDYDALASLIASMHRGALPKRSIVLCNGAGCVVDMAVTSSSPFYEDGDLLLVRCGGTPRMCDAIVLTCPESIASFASKASESAAVPRRGAAVHFAESAAELQVMCQLPFGMEAMFLRGDAAMSRACTEDERKMSETVSAARSIMSRAESAARISLRCLPGSPSVCVVIATYNRWRQLMDALRTVFFQTMPVAQVIIVDDASTDDRYTLLNSVARQMASCGEEVLTVRMPQNTRKKIGYACPGAVRNVGMSIARGTSVEHQSVRRCDFVAVLDDDDLWMPWKIEVQMREIQSTSGAFACCSEGLYAIGRWEPPRDAAGWKDPISLQRYNREYFKRNHRKPCAPFLSAKERESGAIIPRFIPPALLLEKNVVIHSSFLCHISVFPDYEQIQYGRGMDYVMVKAVADFVGAILYVDEPLVVYEGRVHSPANPKSHSDQ
jgi:glycosyltransferase involved in cell wall biosynthesis